MVKVRSQQATAKKPVQAILLSDLKVTSMLPLLEMGSGSADPQKRWVEEEFWTTST